MPSLFDILRKNINIELYQANKILNQHWEWMKDNKDGKIVVKQVNLKDFYGLNINNGRLYSREVEKS